MPTSFCAYPTRYRYELGMRLTEENIEAARKALGIKSDHDEVGFEVFEKWWVNGPAKDQEVRKSMLLQLSKEMREEYIPHIKEMFAEADDDNSGELDPEEFELFYPKLVSYLGYALPPVEQVSLFAAAHSARGAALQLNASPTPPVGLAW